MHVCCEVVATRQRTPACQKMKNVFGHFFFFLFLPILCQWFGSINFSRYHSQCQLRLILPLLFKLCTQIGRRHTQQLSIALNVHKNTVGAVAQLRSQSVQGRSHNCSPLACTLAMLTGPSSNSKCPRKRWLRPAAQCRSTARLHVDVPRSSRSASSCLATTRCGSNCSAAALRQKRETCCDRRSPRRAR